MSRKNEAKWIASRQRWQINVQSDGERKTFASTTAGTKGKVDCERKADKWLTTQLVDENTRVDKLAAQYLSALDLRSHEQYVQYEKYMRLYILPRIGKKRIGAVNENDLQAIIDSAYRERKLSKKTLQNIAGCIKSFIKYCRKAKATSLFVEDGFLIPKQAAKSDKQILLPDELKTLFTTDTTVMWGTRRKDPYIWLYRWIVTYGFRPGENCGLMLSDINGDMLTIKRSINHKNVITAGKNDNAQRTEKIGNVGRWILDSQQTMLKSLGIKSVYIFPNTSDGDILHQCVLLKHWHRYCDANGIKTATTPYELRHTFNSINDTMPDYLRKQVMGHSKNMDTNGTYGHQKKSDLDKIANCIDKTMSEYITDFSEVCT